MNRGASRTESGLEVQVVFEPNRLKKEFIADAYERVLPAARRTISRGGEKRTYVVEAGARCVGSDGA